MPSAVRSRPLRQTGGAQDGRLIGPSYEACDAELKQSILDTLIHLTWPILLRSLHLLFDSLQSSQFKGAAALLPPSLSLPPLFPPTLPRSQSRPPRIDGEGEKLMTRLSNQFTQLCHTQYVSEPMRGDEGRWREEERGEEKMRTEEIG